MARIPEIATSLRTAEKLSKDLKTARTLMNNTVRKVANNWIYKWLITRGC